MNKYNHGSSIPINSLSKEDLNTAIKEWSEGDKKLEEFLWSCYNLKIETSGCHSFDGEFYVGFEYDENKKEEFCKIMNATLLMKDTQILISPDGGNPFSGKNWYLPSITIGTAPIRIKHDTSDYHLKTLNKVINNEIDMSNLADTSSLLDLIDFLKEKLTLVSIRINHTLDDYYFIGIECPTEYDCDLFNYFNNTLLDLGYSFKTDNEGIYKMWQFTTNDLSELNIKIHSTVSQLIKNYSLEILSNIEDTDKLKIKAHIARKQLSEEEFDEWLKETKHKMNSDKKTSYC